MEDIAFKEARERKQAILDELKNLENRLEEARRSSENLENLKKEVARTASDAAKAKLDLVRLEYEASQSRHNLLTSRRDEEEARKNHQENLESYKRSMDDLTKSHEARKLALEKEITDLENRKKEIIEASATLKRTFETEFKDYVAKRDVAMAEAEKWESDFNGRRNKAEKDLEDRLKSVEEKELYADKRARWNEQVRVKLVQYKQDLEDHFKHPFRDLIIGDK